MSFERLVNIDMDTAWNGPLDALGHRTHIDNGKHTSFFQPRAQRFNWYSAHIRFSFFIRWRLAGLVVASRGHPLPIDELHSHVPVTARPLRQQRRNKDHDSRRQSHGRVGVPPVVLPALSQESSEHGVNGPPRT